MYLALFRVFYVRFLLPYLLMSIVLGAFRDFLLCPPLFYARCSVLFGIFCPPLFYLLLLPPINTLLSYQFLLLFHTVS